MSQEIAHPGQIRGGERKSFGDKLKTVLFGSKTRTAATLSATITAGAVGTGIVLAGGEGGPDTPVNIPVPTQTIDITPTPMPAGTTLAETPTVIPTEKPQPKTVAWSAEQIAKAQQDALAENRIVFVNTWEDDGGKAVNVENFAQKPFLAVDYEEEPKDKVFESPLTGTVASIGVVSSPDGSIKARTVFLKVGDSEIEFLVDFDSQVQVTRDQKIAAGDPMITLSGNTLPSGLRFSEKGYVIMGDITHLDTTKDSILKDPSGIDVVPQVKN